MHTNTPSRVVWGFMLENTYFTEFDAVNHQIIEDAYNQRKNRPTSYYITIIDSHLSAMARIYFGVAQVHLRMPGTRYHVKRKAIRQTPPPPPPPIDLATFNHYAYQCYGPNCWCIYMTGCCGLIQLPNNVQSNNIRNNYVQNTEMTGNSFAHSSETKSTTCDKNAAASRSPCKYMASSSTDHNFSDGYSLAGDSTTNDSASMYTYSGRSVDSNSPIDINLLDNNLLGNNTRFPNTDSSLLGDNPLDANFFDISFFTFTGNPLTESNYINHVLINNLATWNPVIPSQGVTNSGYQ